MARTEHLPIYKQAYDLCLYIEQVVRGFARYDKYTIGTDLRDTARRMLKLLVRANARRHGGAWRAVALAAAPRASLSGHRRVSGQRNFPPDMCPHCGAPIASRLVVRPVVSTANGSLNNAAPKTWHLPTSDVTSSVRSLHPVSAWCP